MTLVPVHSHLVRGVEGEPAPPNKTCSAVGCLRLAQQMHHIWPRSYLRGQPQNWVRTPWGAVVANTTKLCVEHHGDVTDHRAAIMAEGQTFMWAERPNGEWQVLGPLRPQPGELELDEHEHLELEEGVSCPTCGYRKPRAKAPGPKRPAVTWGVLVPVDTEIGSEVLDGWVDDFAILLGFGGEPSRLKRYHVLAVILAWAGQHRPLLIQDIIESQSR